ncbi:phosphopyruvate hydratase [Microbacterium sp. STN6]|uniref:phosphopyruvate hydratase n=1 Tax=Microbacterium sp. STN6 TaxID=2995588 RepID=UPI002260A304|nr:phosphopyruvate hydratase [Microbacterium sp. STN6]MCX7520866.1 phosphopyruvate hydratase [Microbacterium sp. STN6]
MNEYISHPESVSAPAGEYVSHPSGHALHIVGVTARQILDSRGFPTVSVSLRLDDGIVVEASSPSGASTGEHEAVELRDGGAAYSGKAVGKAVASVTGELARLLTSRPWRGISELDSAMRDLDGTEGYARLGANAVVAVSIAASRAFAHNAQLPLHEWISMATGCSASMPVPHFNVLNGGAHAANDLDFQEFMIAPVGAGGEQNAVEIGADVYHALAKLVTSRFGTAGLGDEGGFAPPIADPRQALDLLVEAIGDAGYSAAVGGVAIAMDPAANGFYVGDGVYRVAGAERSREQLSAYYEALLDQYPIRSIEDGFAEDDHEGWQGLYEKVSDRVQLVGDDIFVTDAERIRDGSRNRYANAALIKPNQIGTVSQTFDAIAAARECGMHAMISHRSGETLDTFIADLAVGTGVGQIKTGAPARGERVGKYNRLMEIELERPGTRFGLG